MKDIKRNEKKRKLRDRQIKNELTVKALTLSLQLKQYLSRKKDMITFRVDSLLKDKFRLYLL